MGFLEILTLVFIVLKLTGLITWGWLAVLSPIIVAVALYIIILMLFIVGAIGSFKFWKR